MLHDDYNMFTRLDVSLTAGSDGLGLDVATPLGDYVQLRTGFAWMPRFETTVTYDVGIGEGEGEGDGDAAGAGAEIDELHALSRMAQSMQLVYGPAG